MITWMQRHKKWLIITIWISTIAFVGAGFVGWGQYSYGDKAGAVAKVGDVEITQGELQKTYSRLYAKYAQMFQGNFDEEKAKQFGLQHQALQELKQQALIVNLAHSYDLKISDKELAQSIREQSVFFENGTFSKVLYKQLLSQNRLSAKEYEKSLKKDLLIQKTLQLLPIEVSTNELNVLNVLSNIADKINYKVLTAKDIKVETTPLKLQEFWKPQAHKFMNLMSYDLEYLTLAPLSLEYDKATLAQHYNDNKSHFKDTDGKILTQKNAQAMIIQELDKKASKDKALRTYIAYKKDKLSSEIKRKSITISQDTNEFNTSVLKKVSKLSLTTPFLKPIIINNTYYVIKLIKINPATPKTFLEAKNDIKKLYIKDTQTKELQKLAENSVENFNGITTEFLSVDANSQLDALSELESKEFLQKLFTSDKKYSYINLNSGKIVLYHILEQKLLDKSNKELKSSMEKLKNGIFGEALLKSLQKKYPTEIFIQGL